MKAAYPVVVLDSARLRSELAMFIWQQTDDRRAQQAASGGPTIDEAGFLEDKKLLVLEVAKLAGSKIGNAALVVLLKDTISHAKNKAIQSLSAELMATKISTRAGR